MTTPLRTRHRVIRRLAAAVAIAVLTLATLAGTASAGGAGPHLTQILTGYDRPVMVTTTGAHNRRIFIVEQGGKIKIAAFVHGAWKQVGTFLDLTGQLATGGEQGLLGLAFAPDYGTSGRFYVDYTRGGTPGHYGDTVIDEFRRKSSNRADPRSRRQVMLIGQPYANHNGGMIAFGPDGYLYIGMGDGGSGGDPQGRAQNLGSLLGKLLRIDPRDPDGAGPRRYRVPADNPFVGTPHARREIWSLGLRNPWRWSFDRGTGDLLIGDVGQNLYEEVDHVPATAGVAAGKGVNFGWNVCEGLHAYTGAADPGPCTQHTLPIVEYGHDEGCAVTGGFVYRGPDSPAWHGAIVYSDYCSGTLWVLPEGASAPVAFPTGKNVSGFGEDAAGRLYLVDLGGTISLVTFSGAP